MGSSARIPRLRETFQRVLRIVRQTDPAMAAVRLNLACDGILADRRCRSGARQFMHVNHFSWTICSAPEAGGLTLPHRVGLLLHEFGHLGSMGGEMQADRWAFERLGIPIQYRGRLCLEWVDPKIIRRLGI